MTYYLSRKFCFLIRCFGIALQRTEIYGIQFSSNITLVSYSGFFNTKIFYLPHLLFTLFKVKMNNTHIMTGLFNTILFCSVGKHNIHSNSYRFDNSFTEIFCFELSTNTWMPLDCHMENKEIAHGHYVSHYHHRKSNPENICKDIY